jgi:hypothetical protein
VEFFHDMAGQSILVIANQIRSALLLLSSSWSPHPSPLSRRSDGIHILLNWDGYSNNGVRPAGLFPMQTAPIQVAHQVSLAPLSVSQPPPPPSSHHILSPLLSARSISAPWGQTTSNTSSLTSSPRRLDLLHSILRRSSTTSVSLTLTLYSVHLSPTLFPRHLNGLSRASHQATNTLQTTWQ